MRLWSYYALHSFINTIKKLFRSTVMIVIAACVGMGLIFGAVGGIIGSVAERQNAEESVDGDYIDESDQEDDEGLTVDDAVVKTCVEAGLTVIFLIFLLWGLYSGSKKGTEIFLMADVNFLFTAPMKPQSVLMFRLTFQMVAVLFGSVYLVAQIPNLMNIGLGAPAIAAVFIGWVMLFLFQRLMIVLSYTVCTTHERLKKYLIPFIGCIAAALLAVSAAVFYRVDRDPIAMLDVLYASRWSRWIPLVGWYKGMIMSAVNENMTQFFIFLLLMIAGIAGFVWLIWQFKADFYEDALNQASKTAATLEAAKEGRKTRARERSKRIKRTGSFGGFGGSVFFTKELYDRRRNAWFGFATGTMLFYLAVSLLIVMAMYRLTDQRSFLVPGIVLMVILFFRNFGNPIAREAAMNWLFLVPDSPYRKVFFTMLAGSVGCAIDFAPAIAAGIFLAREHVLVMLLWLLAFVVVDFMLSAVGAFLEAVFPASAMDVAKSVLRMMLHFFMILVLTVFMAVGFLISGITLALFITIVGSAVIGGLFFLIYPSILHQGVA